LISASTDLSGRRSFSRQADKSVEALINQASIGERSITGFGGQSSLGKQTIPGLICQRAYSLLIKKALDCRGVMTASRTH